MPLQMKNNMSVCLRKSYLFNKGRYSRTRQIVRGAFFFSLLLNINVIFGALLMYYLYTIKLSYIWWLFYTLLISFVFPATLRRTSIRMLNSSWTWNVFKMFSVFRLNVVKLFKIFSIYLNINFLKYIFL
jgi:hypothetical protein